METGEALSVILLKDNKIGFFCSKVYVEKHDSVIPYFLLYKIYGMQEITDSIWLQNFPHH